MQGSQQGARSERPLDRPATVRTVSARELLGDDDRVRIDLDGELYTLRLTRNHRLILTK